MSAPVVCTDIAENCSTWLENNKEENTKGKSPISFFAVCVAATCSYIWREVPASLCSRVHTYPNDIFLLSHICTNLWEQIWWHDCRRQERAKLHSHQILVHTLATFKFVFPFSDIRRGRLIFPDRSATNLENKNWSIHYKCQLYLVWSV